MEENEGYTQPLNSFADGERNDDVLRPYGVFGVIAPFNFPVALVDRAWRGSALIAGNTVVFKPSEETPRHGRPLAEAIARRRTAGRASQPRARRAATPGARSWTRARRRHRLHRLGGGWAGRSRGSSRTAPYARPALTEMGGKNPAIVTASADVDAAAEGVARSAFGFSGQKCSACSRAIVVATRCTTSSWTGSPRGRRSSRSAIRATRRRSWGR